MVCIPSIAETCGVGIRTVPPLADFQPNVPAILEQLDGVKGYFLLLAK